MPASREALTTGISGSRPSSVFTMSALSIAGLGVVPLLLSRHHSVRMAAPPVTWGDDMLVPEHTECVLEFGAAR